MVCNYRVMRSSHMYRCICVHYIHVDTHRHTHINMHDPIVHLFVSFLFQLTIYKFSKFLLYVTASITCPNITCSLVTPHTKSIMSIKPLHSGRLPRQWGLDLANAARMECHRAGDGLSQRNGEFQITERRAMPWPVSRNQEKQN